MPSDRPDPIRRFFTELRRRRVFRVAAAYAVAGWITIEVASVLVPGLLLPEWIVRGIIVLVLAGFPVALVLGWAFDLTPGGVERTGDLPKDASPAGAPREGSTEGEASARSPRHPLFRPLFLAVLGVVLVASAASILMIRSHRARLAEARGLLTKVDSLIQEDRFASAYHLAAKAEEVLPGDTLLSSFWPAVSDLLTVRTDPPGAAVRARTLASDSGGDEGVLLGTTPLLDVRVPRTAHLLFIEKDGFLPVERLASSALIRDESWGQDRSMVVEVSLVPQGEAPPGTVHVPGGRYELVSLDLPSGLAASLDDYFIGRFEVSNAEFRAFVANGGYQEPDLWPFPVVEDGDTVTFAEGVASFVDRTGLGGPRGWTSQAPPEGRDDHPVTGVSWYEAAAYCAYRDMTLPSVFQWEKTARDGLISHGEGVVMPWGFVDPRDPDRGRANMAGSGTVPIDAHPFGISPYGAYAMAGNVKEWTANPMGDRRIVTGGSWEDPLYLFSEYGGFDPAAASPALGFRCARVRPTDARRHRDQGTFALSIDEETPTYEAVDEATYRTLLSHYQYDPRPLNPEILRRVETPEWVREKISYAGPEEGRVLAYLWRPKSTPAPHQTILYVPGADTFFGTNVHDHVEWSLGGLIRSGRAIFAVVLKGMVERPFEPDHEPPETSTVRFRDLMVRHATEISLGLDYLETRDDVDMDRLAYAGVSFGAGSRLPFAAVEDRYGAVVLIGGGIDERLKPTLPAADNVNFAPYLRPPTLLVNGRQDEEHPWLTRGLPLWNLLTEPKELVLVENAGHVPPAEILIPTVNDFLDEILGPLRR